MPVCFVIMGFGKKTDLATGRELDLDKSYKNIIKPAVTAAGYECVRADEIQHSGVIDVPMYEMLFAADLVVAADAFVYLGDLEPVCREAARVLTPSGLLAFSVETHPGPGVILGETLRWAHGADPNALLFYNDYSIEAPGAKFNAVYSMVKDFVTRGVPIHGVGIQAHIDTSGYPASAGLAQNIQQLTALGLQVHITELDVKLPVDSNGNASAADLQTQAQTYQRILTVCLQNPGCTAFQTWGFTDKHSWIPSSYPGHGAALPFDASYQPKPAYSAMISALQTVPPTLNASAIVNAASYKGGAVAPGELVTLFQANYGPGTLVGAQLDKNGLVSSNLASTQLFFDGAAAPLIYALAGQVSAVVPFEVAGKQQTVIQYEYNGVTSNTVTIPVVQSLPAIFAADETGSGPGSILNQDYSLNTAANPAPGGSVIQVLATGGGTIKGGATDGALAPGVGSQTLPVTATIGGVPATVVYAGPAPGEVNGVLQVNLTIPSGLTGAQPVIITAGNVSSQNGITVAVK